MSTDYHRLTQIFKYQRYFDYHRFYLIELEITLGVVVGDVLYHARKYLVVVGKKTLLYVVAEDVAEQTKP